MDELLEDLRKLCQQRAIRWTDHVLKRMMQRGIARMDVLTAIQNGTIIEQYPDDYPYPSCLILGYGSQSKPLHVVCSQGEQEAWMITAYWPDPAEWESDWSKRRGTT